jgi:hypothetical protein
LIRKPTSSRGLTTIHTFGLKKIHGYIVELSSIAKNTYTVKKRFAIFPSPAKLSLAGEKIILFPAKESLISVIPAGDGNITDLFHSVLYGITSMVALIL